jgi:hypothetical protein
MLPILKNAQITIFSICTEASEWIISCPEGLNIVWKIRGPLRPHMKTGKSGFNLKNSPVTGVL